MAFWRLAYNLPDEQIQTLSRDDGFRMPNMVGFGK
jgi:hypothetical protein